MIVATVAASHAVAVASARGANGAHATALTRKTGKWLVIQVSRVLARKGG